jgi:hypothetical protein
MLTLRDARSRGLTAFDVAIGLRKKTFAGWASPDCL